MTDFDELNDAQLARLARSADPRERELAWSQLIDMMPSLDSVERALRSGEPDAVKAAKSMIHMGWRVVSKIAGGNR